MLVYVGGFAPLEISQGCAVRADVNWTIVRTVRYSYLQEWEARREWRLYPIPEIRIIAVLEAITTLFSVEKLIALGHSVLSLLQCTGVHVHSKYADPYWIKAVVPHFLTDILWVNGIETSRE